MGKSCQILDITKLTKQTPKSVVYDNWGQFVFFFPPIFWFSEHLKKDLVINGKTCLKTFFLNTRKMLYKPKSESKCEAKFFQIFFSKLSEFLLQKKKWNMQQKIFFFFLIQLNCKTKGEVNWCRLVVSFK